MIAPLARILARYLAGYLVLKGMLDPHLGSQIGADADVLKLLEMLLGAALGCVTEFWYWLAKRLGWKT